MEERNEYSLENHAVNTDHVSWGRAAKRHSSLVGIPMFLGTVVAQSLLRRGCGEGYPHSAATPARILRTVVFSDALPGDGGTVPSVVRKKMGDDPLDDDRDLAFDDLAEGCAKNRSRATTTLHPTSPPRNSAQSHGDGVGTTPARRQGWISLQP